MTPSEKILLAILQTLEEIKNQEKQYWEIWKESKEREINDQNNTCCR
jgi:hypothetical protein